MKTVKFTGIKESRPFPHQSRKGEWLLPIKQIDGHSYIFYLGHGYSKTMSLEYIRDFESWNHKDLGLEVKDDLIFKIIRLRIYPYNQSFITPPDQILTNEVYLYLPPFVEEEWREFVNIDGYRVTQSWWVIVIKEQILNALRGKPIIEELESDILKESDALIKRLRNKNK